MRLAKRILVVTLLLSLILCLCSCGSSYISGVYVKNDPEIDYYDSIVFNADGTGTFVSRTTQLDFTYTMSGSNIYIDAQIDDEFYDSLLDSMMDIGDISYRKSGDSIFVEDLEYVLEEESSGT